MKEITSDQLVDRLENMHPAIKNYSKAKAERVYIEQYRKSLKAILMIDGKKSGKKTIAECEAYAYSNQKYLDLISGLKEAVEVEERHKWALERLKMELEVWRSLNANERYQKDKL